MFDFRYDAEAEARVIRQEGGTTRACEVAKNLLAEGSMSREEIAGITGLTLKEVDELVTVH